MKFRHPHGVRLAMTSGHVAIVGPDWRELHVDMHREALAKGCECDQATIRTQAAQPPGASESAGQPLDESKAIRAALIAMINRNGLGDFTAAGTPNLNALAKETGFKVDKTQALEVWHQLEAEAKGAAGEGAAEGEGANSADNTQGAE